MFIIPKNENEHQRILAEIEELLLKGSNCSEEEKNELEVKTILVQKYETDQYRHSIGYPDPIEFLKYIMVERGLTRRDLEKYIGTSGRVSEILNRKRELTLPMIRKLHEHLHIPAEILIRKTQVVA